MKSIEDYLKQSKDINYNSWFKFSGLDNLSASAIWMSNIKLIQYEKKELQKTRKQQG
jgi:hypothetical protein